MAKRYVSKMFGMGKTSKEKPGPLLDMTRDLYDELSAKIEELQEQIPTQDGQVPQTQDEQT